MNKFFYIEESSTLLDQNGIFIKYVFCPKARYLNQLIGKDLEKSEWICKICSDKVINLDIVDIDESLALLKENPSICVYASINSKNVKFVNNRGTLFSQGIYKDKGLAENPHSYQEIRVETNLESINHAAKNGYWPDAVVVNKEHVMANSYFQNSLTGKISLGHKPDGLDFIQLKNIVQPLSDFSSATLGAYLMPPNLKEGDHVHIPRLISLPDNHELKQLPAVCSADAIVKNKKLVINTQSLVPYFYLIG